MKKHANKIIAAAVALLVLMTVAADSFLGSKTVVATIHATTNYVQAILGNDAASGYRLISPSNLVAVQSTVIIGKTNLSTLRQVGDVTVVSPAKISAAWIPTNCQCSFQIANGGAAITAGQYGLVGLPNSFTPDRWEVYVEPSGSIVVDVWQDTFANLPPTVADTMTGSDKPTVSGAISAQDTSITWNNATNDYWIKWSVDSATTVTQAFVRFKGRCQ